MSIKTFPILKMFAHAFIEYRYCSPIPRTRLDQHAISDTIHTHVKSFLYHLFYFILFYKFAIAIDLYRVLWLQMTGISTQR